VGVVADTKYQSQREKTEPLLYTPWKQDVDDIGVMHFAVRTINDPTSLVGQLRSMVHDLDSNLAVTEITTQSARSHTTLAQERLYAQLFSFFGALALGLAGIGLFGVLAYSVGQRTREIGVRMAFGAQASNVIWMIVLQGMKLVFLGLAASSLIGYALARLLNSQYFGRDSWQQRMKEQLYEVRLGDPLTLIVIGLLLTIVALIACWLPARRAAKVDPLVALKYE
jgi:putative ABC transport system permease protein